MSEMSFEQMLDASLKSIHAGEIVTGKVISVKPDEIALNIGYKSDGIMTRSDYSADNTVDLTTVVNVGDEIECKVKKVNDGEGQVVLSHREALASKASEELKDAFENQTVLTGKVVQVVKGGLILDIGLRGFLPASLVDLRRVKDLTSYMGTRIEARVIEMDRNRNNVVLSRRVVLEESRKAERSEILSKLKSGMRLQGTVSSIVDFGAFVDLGGIDGLIHISELSWNHVNHPSEVVKVGQEVEVEVLDVDLNRERISLGLKQTTEDPWRALVKKYPVGAIVEGTVTKLVPFGAFVDLGEGIEGLVHISEMAMRHIDTPAQVVKPGQDVKVKVMEISPERRRISLSMKAAAEELGYEIEVDESVQVEEKPAKKREKKAEKPAEEQEAE